MKKILTIDGGGIKGILAASFLAELEKRCGVRICEYFDLIAGTSTGGMIAAGMALGVPAETVLEMYLEKGREIFPKRKLWSLFKGKYDTNPLQQALREVFGEKQIKDCKTRLLIPAYNLENRKVRVFKTPHAEDLYIDKDYKIVDCLLSTTAAPLYFKPYKMNGGVFVDGGIGANNPSLIALVEGITRCGWEVSDICMLSLGSANEPVQTTGGEGMGLLDALKIQKCFMEAESQYADNICKIMLPKDQYVRITQEALRKQVSLDNASEESMRKLQDWGFDLAMNHIDEIKRKFLDKKIEEVTFHNL